MIGSDNLSMARETMPPLTSIRQDIAAGVRGPVQLLLRRMAGDGTESLVMPPQLVCAKRPSRLG